MKKKKYLKIFLLIFIPAVLSSCAATVSVPKGEKSPSAKSPSAQIEDLNPAALPDTVFTLKGKAPSGEKVPSLRQPETSSQEEIPGKQKLLIVSGYRIQIAALSNEEEAMTIRKEAMLKFGEQNVYLIFDPPYYKIRVGDFLTRYEAEKLQTKAVKLGFKDAWIVRTKVKTTRAEEY